MTTICDVDGRPSTLQFDEATAILAGDALQAEAFRTWRARSRSAKNGRIDTGTRRRRGARHTWWEASPTIWRPNPPRSRDCRLRNRRISRHGIRIVTNARALGIDPSSKDRGTFRGFAGLGCDSLRRKSERRQDSCVITLGRSGLAFQVVDDLLDSPRTRNVLGKRAGKDADRGKLTYPGLLGIDRLEHKAEQLVESSRHRVRFSAPRRGG